MEARRVESVGGDPILTRILGPGPFYEVSVLLSFLLFEAVLILFLYCHSYSLLFFAHYLLHFSYSNIIDRSHPPTLIDATLSSHFNASPSPQFSPLPSNLLLFTQSHEQEGKSRSGLYVKACDKISDSIEDYTQMFCRRCYTYNCR
jgi:hypothetical protein